MDPNRRPVNRTPPDYQTIIKFLLMSSILDALWGGGEPTGCGLVTTSRPPFDQGELPVNDLEDTPHSWEHQDELRLGKTAPLLIRVLSLLTFNVFVLWTDFGAVLVHQHQQAVGGAPTWRRSPSRWMEEGSAIDIDTPWTNTSSCAVPGVTSPAPTSPARSVTSSPPRSPSRSAPRSPPRPPPRSVSPASRDPYWEEALAYSVPWHTQLLYIAMLMLVVVGVPRCPVVLENACTFLMC